MLPALTVVWGSHRAARQKGRLKMFALTSARDTATAFAAAFITAMLFVSTATSAFPIA
jgi:hypothetical protein